MFKRNIRPIIEEALRDTPVILINGARQVGKSTLVKSLIDEGYPARYVTLDDPTILSAAHSDPQAFLQGLGPKAAIDEVQRAPGLFLPMKKIVDEQKAAGQYILNGSANILTLPKISESLAGRMEIHTLWPLSQGEIRSHKETFIETVFSSEPLKKPSFHRWEDICEILISGGFPEILNRPLPRRRTQWFQSYLSSILQKDIRDLSNIEGLTELPKLLAILANRTANLLNTADISRMSGITATTLKRYFTLLQTVFLVQLLPAWFTNRDKRITKAPKVYLNDTGFLCHLRQIDKDTLLDSRFEGGSILESFVVLELIKQISWSLIKPSIYHFRNQAGHEVDIVLELPNGKVVGIEVKTSSSVSISDFKGLQTLADLSASKFHRGIILYVGENVVSFQPNMYAIPIGALWEY